jgi:hypothetical protein
LTTVICRTPRSAKKFTEIGTTRTPLLTASIAAFVAALMTVIPRP